MTISRDFQNDVFLFESGKQLQPPYLLKSKMDRAKGEESMAVFTDAEKQTPLHYGSCHDNTKLLADKKKENDDHSDQNQDNPPPYSELDPQETTPVISEQPKSSYAKYDIFPSITYADPMNMGCCGCCMAIIWPLCEPYCT